MEKRYSIIIVVFLCVLVILLARVSSNRMYRKPGNYSGSDPTSYVYPGEFEKQQAIWMQWPSGVYST
ncbi:MAG: agmatine deiminase family protein, partial [Firmicutes bacterium]|nr:agmatine deiminase family protein [Bacillota bacterium]